MGAVQIKISQEESLMLQEMTLVINPYRAELRQNMLIGNAKGLIIWGKTKSRSLFLCPASNIQYSKWECAINIDLVVQLLIDMLVDLGGIIVMETVSYTFVHITDNLF